MLVDVSPYVTHVTVSYVVVEMGAVIAVGSVPRRERRGGSGGSGGGDR